jgi:hypothetical protein
MFLHFSNDNNLTEKYIKSVTYRPGAPFDEDPPEIKLPRAPFLLSRDFSDPHFVQVDMLVTIEFQDWTEMDSFTFDYFIGFD